MLLIAVKAVYMGQVLKKKKIGQRISYMSYKKLNWQVKSERRVVLGVRMFHLKIGFVTLISSLQN